MDESLALDCLAAMSQETRLRVLRLLIASEPGGVPAGVIALRLGIAQNTMSTHLAALARCGLIRGERRSRSIVYRGDLARFRALLVYLLEDCCAGRPEICLPLRDEIVPRLLAAVGSKER